MMHHPGRQYEILFSRAGTVCAATKYNEAKIINWSNPSRNLIGSAVPSRTSKRLARRSWIVDRATNIVELSSSMNLNRC